jgi:hypothetical protein
MAFWILAFARMTTSPEPVSLKGDGQRTGAEPTRNSSLHRARGPDVRARKFHMSGPARNSP